MLVTKKQLQRVIREEVARVMSEGLIQDLEQATGETLVPGRNHLWGCPVDIEDGDPSEGLVMRAVDRDASVDLLKLLRSNGFRASFDKRSKVIVVLP